jgi:uncharacterized protein YndB with AHSA1/START domain
MRAEPVQLAFWTSAGPAQVWQYFTSPEKLSLWHGTAERFEAWPGGRVCFRDPGWDPVEGTVTHAEPERFLRWQIPADASSISETFHAGDSGTHVRVLQQGTEKDWPRDGLAGRVRGWEESIADLVLILDHGVRAARHLASRADAGLSARDIPAGLSVAAVDPDGPADAAGLRPGDIIVRIGTAPVYRRTDLSLLLRAHAPGQSLPVGYVRDRELRQAVLTLGPAT